MRVKPAGGVVHMICAYGLSLLPFYSSRCPARPAPRFWQLDKVIKQSVRFIYSRDHGGPTEPHALRFTPAVATMSTVVFSIAKDYPRKIYALFYCKTTRAAAAIMQAEKRKTKKEEENSTRHHHGNGNGRLHSPSTLVA